MSDSTSIMEETWEAELERQEREDERRAALAYAESLRVAYADPDAPPRAPDSVIQMTGTSREVAPGAIGQLLMAQVIKSSALNVADMLNMIQILEIPRDTMVMGVDGTDGTDTYLVTYADPDGRNQTIDLGPNRVLAEWAEAILAERRQHPRPSDLV